MVIDPSKVNLTEADIEEYLWQNPGAVTVNMYVERVPIARWLKRQLAIPNGKLDLFGETEGGTLVLVEIKNVEVDSRAVAQVCRYAYDMFRIMTKINKLTCPEIEIRKIIVGPEITDVAFRECEACSVEFLKFEVKLSLHTSPLAWTKEFLRRREDTWNELANDEVLRDTAIYNEQSRAYADYEIEALMDELAAKRQAKAEGEAEDKEIADAIEDYLIEKSNRGEPDE